MSNGVIAGCIQDDKPAVLRLLIIYSFIKIAVSTTIKRLIRFYNVQSNIENSDLILIQT